MLGSNMMRAMLLRQQISFHSNQVL